MSPDSHTSEEAPEVTQTVENQEEIVIFSEDKAKVDEGIPLPVSRPFTAASQHTDYENQSVISFLQRPLHLSSFRWATSTARSENILSIRGVKKGLRIPSDILASKPIYRNKLDGFTSFKATAVIQLKVNSHPFQAGRLVMAAVPMPELLGHRADFIFRHVSTAQNVHHVQMDIAKDTCIELRVPFISPYNCYDLVDKKFNWAEVRILVYSPLNQVGGCPLECALYTWFEDIELGAPTSGPVQQSAPSPQNVEGARKKEATGKFTGALSLLGGAVNAARPVAGLADRALAAIGWSKPVLAQPAQVLLNRPTEGFGLCDGVDHSLVLGMSGGNSVDTIPNICGTGQDETSFDVLKRIPQFVAAFRYTDQTTPSSDPDNPTCPLVNDPLKLWSCCVSPSTHVPACYYVSPDATITPGVKNPFSFRWKQPTTLNYITSPFLYWTGSMVYTFKFVKTSFHSGRVEISFHPFVNKDSGDITARCDYTRRVIVDLRESSEVSLTVPFISPQPWKRISTYLDPMNPKPPKPGRLKDITTGMIIVRAITPLICSGPILARDIEVLVECRAGDDFQVQAPVTSKYLPFSFANPTNSVGPQEQSASKTKSVWEKLDDYFKEKKDIRQQSYSPQPARRIRMFGTRNNVVPVGIANGLYGSQTISINVHAEIVSVNAPREYYLEYEIDIDWAKGEPIILTGRGPASIDKYSVTIPSIGLDEVKFGFRLLKFLNTGAPIPEGDVSINILIDVYPNYSMSQNTVSIDRSQLPLPIAIKGGDVLQTYVTNDVNKQSDIIPVGVRNPVAVFPYPDESFVFNAKIVNTPLPVKTDGGSAGGQVRIADDQLPLWVSTLNVAPNGPPHTADTLVERTEVDMIADGPRQQSVSGAGITETRTRAMEGWMPPSITGNAIDAHRVRTEHWCSGERFDSMRQLTRRFAFCLVNQVASNAPLPIQPIELIRPGALTMRLTAGVNRTQFALYARNSKSEVSGSPLAFVSSMYAFYRGGVRLKTWVEGRANPPALISANLEYIRQNVDSVDVIYDNMENFMSPIAYETPNLKQFGEFQVPYYSPTLCSSIWSHAVDNQFDAPLAQVNICIPDSPVKNGAPTVDTAPIKIAVAGADDFDLHGFLGPPPCLDIQAIPRAGRPIHYPPSGFTPTQKIIVDPNVKEEAATSFFDVPYSILEVKPNVGGTACPAQANSDESQDPLDTNRVARKIRSTSQEGYDTVDQLGGDSYPSEGGRLSYYDSPNY